MNSRYQQNVKKARPWLYVKDVYVMHTGSRFCTQACTFNFLIRKAPLATLTFKQSLLLVCAELGCEYKSLSDHLHFERNQNLNLWLTTTTWQKFRLRGVSTGGQLLLLDQPVYEAWPSDDCTVPPLCPAWDPKTLNADLLIPAVRIVCLTALAEDTQISGSIETAAFSRMYQEEGQLTLAS